jgi:hypothetical protein
MLKNRSRSRAYGSVWEREKVIPLGLLNELDMVLVLESRSVTTGSVQRVMMIQWRFPTL